MKYKIEDNHLKIYYNDGELKEDATENIKECEYCEYKPKTCNASSETKMHGGMFCDKMKCKYEEI